MEMEVESIYFSSWKLGWQNLTGCPGTREFSIGDVGKNSGLSYTLQMNNPAASQNPGTSQQAIVWGTSWRGRLRAGVVFFLLTSSHKEREGQSKCMCARMFLHCFVMFKWERGVIFLFRALGVWLYAVGLHLLTVCLKVLTASIFLSWALEVKGTC